MRWERDPDEQWALVWVSESWLRWERDPDERWALVWVSDSRLRRKQTQTNTCSLSGSGRVGQDGKGAQMGYKRPSGSVRVG